MQSCDEVYECIFNINPEIHDKPLELGFVGERYYGLITAEISNEVNDDDYHYDFEVFGNLPPGIFFDINRRSIEFYGIPEDIGTYRFEVELFVESWDYDGYDGSPTCSDSAVREFVIQVVD
ncbi:hypothetical protein [Flagellimonas amphidinii]|nr:hypothetical protein [Allomuricauda amphidinii]